jgi:hypothetical protein
VRFSPALLLLIALTAALWCLLVPQTWVVLETVRDLGPIAGWRCAQSVTYSYDPNRERPDSTLLSEAPEARVLAQVPWFEIDHVEANLRGGDTLVSAHGAMEPGGPEHRVYVLSPGRLQTVFVNETRVCNVHLSNWQIVGEQELG